MNMYGNLDNLFSENTKILQLIYHEIKTKFEKNGEIEDDYYKSLLDEINEIIQDSYEKDNEDVEDMEDLIRGCNMIMDILFISKENLLRYEEISLCRKKAKKLAHKKFREAHDFYYKKEIEKGNMDKIIKYDDEKPRDILNVEECVHQYACLVEYVWNPSCVEFKKKLVEYGLNTK